jgi:hypothetical protein
VVVVVVPAVLVETHRQLEQLQLHLPVETVVAELHHLSLAHQFVMQLVVAVEHTRMVVQQVSVEHVQKLQLHRVDLVVKAASLQKLRQLFLV